MAAPRNASEVLRSLRGVKEDSNNWPNYNLVNATVYLEDGVTIANIFDVFTNQAALGPCMVVGELEFDSFDAQKTPEFKRLLNPAFKSERILVENLDQYSFGVGNEAGSATIYVGSDKYGWFIINASDDYKNVKAEMDQAADLHYFFGDFYKRPNAKDLKLEDIILAYATREGSGKTLKQLQKFLHKYARFLHTRMMADWDLKHTVIYKWLERNSPPLAPISFRKLSALALRAKAQPAPSIPASRSTQSAPSGLLKARAAFNHKQPDSSERSESGEPTTNAGLIAMVAEEVLEAQALNKRPKARHEIGCHHVWLRLYQKCTVRRPDIAAQLVKIHAPELKALMSESWKGTLLLRQLNQFIPLPPPENAGEAEARKEALTVIIKRRMTQRFIQAQAKAKKEGRPVEEVLQEIEQKTSTRRVTTSRPLSPASNRGSESHETELHVDATRVQNKRPRSQDTLAERASWKTLGDMTDDEYMASISVGPDPRRGVKRIPGMPCTLPASLHPVGYSIKKRHKAAEPNLGEMELDTDLHSNPGSSTTSSTPSSPSEESDYVFKFDRTSIIEDFSAWKDQHGRYACRKKTSKGSPCTFCIFDMESPNALEKFRAHVRDHDMFDNRANMKEVVTLESALHGQSSQHLQELMQQRLAAEEKRIDDSRQVINGVKVPYPIKRSIWQ